MGVQTKIQSAFWKITHTKTCQVILFNASLIVGAQSVSGLIISYLISHSQFGGTSSLTVHRAHLFLPKFVEEFVSTLVKLQIL